MTLSEKYSEISNKYKIVGNACELAIGDLCLEDGIKNIQFLKSYVESFNKLNDTHHQYIRLFRYLESHRYNRDAEYLSYEWMYNYVIDDLIMKYNKDSDKYNLFNVKFDINVSNNNYVEHSSCLTKHQFPTVSKLHAKDCYQYLDNNLNYQTTISKPKIVDNMLTNVSEELPIFIYINLEKN